MSALFPLAVAGGCEFEGPALPTDVTSDTTPELPGLAGSDGLSAPTEPLASTESPPAAVRADEGDTGADPGGGVPAAASTDVGAKPR